MNIKKWFLKLRNKNLTIISIIASIIFLLDFFFIWLMFNVFNLSLNYVINNLYSNYLTIIDFISQNILVFAYILGFISIICFAYNLILNFIFKKISAQKKIALLYFEKSVKIIEYFYDFIITVVFVFIIGVKDNLIDVAFIMFPKEAVNYTPSVFELAYNLFVYFFFCFILIFNSTRKMIYKIVQKDKKINITDNS